MEAHRAIEVSLRRLTLLHQPLKPPRSNSLPDATRRIRPDFYAQNRSITCCKSWRQPASATPAKDSPTPSNAPNKQNPDLEDTAPSTSPESSAGKTQKPSATSFINFDRIDSQIDESVGSAFGTTAKQRAKDKRTSVTDLAAELRKKYDDFGPHKPGRRAPTGTKVPVDSMKLNEDDIIEDAKRTHNLKERDPSIQKSLTDLVPNRSLPATVAPNIRLGPTLGRTIEVNDKRRMDLGRAFRMLEVKCSQNSVRRDFNKQRFHERPGLKRKRLKSERWRARFKTNFKQVIRRVEEMRRKGW
ncbi:MAG: hypothetical protein M1831_005203 [Alyxoria varia]|nr:MAG: hypothetical protein M1831_005203 [Alyxoria varia]